MESLNFKETEVENHKKNKLIYSRERVDRIIDKLGHPIDENIKDMVAILNAMDFPTTSSCGGHVSGEGAVGFPYIEIYIPCQEEGWQTDKVKSKKCRDRIIPFGLKMESYLNEFYEDKEVDEFDRIGFVSKLPHGFRIQPMGVKEKPDVLGIKSVEDLDFRIKKYQEQMSLFTDFLRSKYFSS